MMLLSDCKVTTYICTNLIFTIKIRLQSRNETDEPKMETKIIFTSCLKFFLFKQIFFTII